MDDPAIYALKDPNGDIKKVSMDLSAALNYFPPNVFSAEMWNELFDADAEKRIDIFTKNGWVVTKGYYTQQYVLS